MRAFLLQLFIIFLFSLMLFEEIRQNIKINSVWIEKIVATFNENVVYEKKKRIYYIFVAENLFPLSFISFYFIWKSFKTEIQIINCWQITLQFWFLLKQKMFRREMRLSLLISKELSENMKIKEQWKTTKKKKIRPIKIKSNSVFSLSGFVIRYESYARG